MFRDVQFNPHWYWQFAAVSENGKIQIWDMRRPDRWTRNNAECYISKRSIDYRIYMQQITQPSQYRYVQLQYRFAVISESLSIILLNTYRL